MTEARRKAKIALLQQKRTLEDLARECGLSVATIHNVLDGKASSAKSKQTITDALQAQIFEGVWPNPQLLIRVGTEVVFTSEYEARKEAVGLGERVKVEGSVLTFVKDTSFVPNSQAPKKLTLHT